MSAMPHEMNLGMRQAVFLDRDDTILMDTHYMSDPHRIQIIPGVKEALQLLQEANFQLVLISNQSGVARGLITIDQVYAIQKRMCQLLPGISFAGFEYCFHHPIDGCPCRKPKPTLIVQAATRLNVDLSYSFMVGDKESDVAAGNAAGCWSILVQQDPQLLLKSTADFVVPNLAAAVQVLLGLHQAKVR